jgi:hypothetical protein
MEESPSASHSEAWKVCTGPLSILAHLAASLHPKIDGTFGLQSIELSAEIKWSI